jgi:mannose-6-phosphate isomerase-like protein (cupin superfamily)
VVLEGEYLFKVEDRMITADTGSFVYVPGGAIHTFRHVGEGIGRMLTMCQPGGIEEMFAASRPEERAAMEKKHGIENVGPPLDEAQS